MIASQLRDDLPSHSVLNRAASQIDFLGRKLHGFGFAHDRQIADCLTAAIRVLRESHTVPEESRSTMVAEAILQLDVAVGHLEPGEPVR